MQATPLTSLTLGSRRSCTGRRAEAIMSVVGATDWYEQVNDAEENLILGQYPVAFLREVQCLLGARFFRSLCEICPWREVYKRSPGELRFSLLGSLFPFDYLHRDDKSVLHMEEDGLSDHPSTASWRIDDDGTLIMPDVGIVASTDSDLGKGTDQELMADMSMPTSDSPRCIMEFVNLHDRMRERFPSFVKHAICLRQGEEYCEGVILISLLPDEDGPMWYTKLCDFIIRRNAAAVEAIETWDVSGWQIL